MAGSGYSKDDDISQTITPGVVPTTDKHLVPIVVLGKTGLRVSAIGLGCSRLGSTLTDFSQAAAIGLVQHAVARGVTLFDTADIYGQGDSERRLGLALRGRRQDVVLVSKAGQRFTAAQRIVSLAKGPIRSISRRLPALRNAVAAQRARQLPRDFSPDHLRRALEGSLRRLGTEWIDLFLLHSPDVADISQGHTLEMLERARQQGLIRHWGISCDDRATAEAALRVAGVSALQLPLAILQPELQEAAANAQVGLLVREVFGASSDQAPGWRSRRIADALAPANAAVLLGTTRTAHLDEALAGLTVPA